MFRKQEVLQKVESEEKETSVKFAETVLLELETKQSGMSQFHSAMLN